MTNEATKTVEELEAAAREAQERLAEAQRAAAAAEVAKREAEREAKREQERAAAAVERAKRHDAIARLLAPYVDEIRKDGDLTVEMRFPDYSDPFIDVRGFAPYEAVTVGIYEATTRGYGRLGYGARGTGIFSVQVASSAKGGEKRRFPQKKDGSFSTDKILAAIREEIAYGRARAKRENDEKAAKIEAARLASEVTVATGVREHVVVGSYNYYDRYTSKGGEVVAPAGKVILRLGNLTCSPKKAETILAALLAAGFFGVEKK